MADTSAMLCGKCRVTAEGRTESNGDEWISCPRCRREDRLDDAIGEASEYKLSKIVGGGFAALNRGSMTVNHSPDRDYRWIIAD